MCWGGSTRSLATVHAIGTVNLTTPTKTWVSNLPYFGNVFATFPTPSNRGRAPWLLFWHFCKNGGRETPRPSKDGWAVGDAWALSRKSTGDGRAGDGCGRPGPALFSHFLVVIFEIDPTSALSTAWVSLIRMGLPVIGESPPQIGSSKLGPRRMALRSP